ncbi:response regulator [Paenibacillus sp. J5C_2022]|uniref:response regulator n=1 Tax=Paenibacillus sp. J5C2022 TaxID=2977129 RepID=UPI0021CE886D|nr:response regulator [Paenibacillus sp. J5C2022]MCU6712780.1 response regulator [Paenibacillus sp. J5C2022]
MSLRTKGLLLIVLISLIPLLLAGVGNYSAVKQSLLQSEKDKMMSRLRSESNDIAAWMHIRKAEVMVMSRTDAVRFGTEEQRLDYFARELDRNGFQYHFIGYIDMQGNAVRSDGKRLYQGFESFYHAAKKGEIHMTDPYTPTFSDMRQAIIAVPVYNNADVVTGVIYASIRYDSFQEYFDFDNGPAPVFFYNDRGGLIYSTHPELHPSNSLTDRESLFSGIANRMLSGDGGEVRLASGGQSYVVFYTKVAGTPWRMALQEPLRLLEAPLAPVFWRTVMTIAASEIIIALFFYLYFERIVKRLEGVLKVTKQAASGQFQAQHLDTSEGDEIGKLAGSVNGMMEHLQEMFDRLNAIINQNQYAFIVLDDQYRVIHMNKAAEDMLDYQAEELVGQATPLTFIDPEEIRKEAERLTQLLGREVLPGLEVFKELRKEQFSYEREWTVIRKDGKRVPTLHSSNGLYSRDGKFSGVVGMLRDITDRKHVENARNRLLDIVESAKDLIASADMKGRIIYMNRAGRELLGLSDEDRTVESLAVEQYVDPQMYEQLLEGARLAKEYGYWESGAQLLKRGGEPLFVSMVVVAHNDPQTGELFFSCIARDVSEQKLVQEELVRATLEAEEANKAKSRFLAMMSHEVRTPLNGIIGLTQLMRKMELTALQRDYMDKMETSSESLLRIINDVLDFSKIEAGKIEVERLPFQLEEVLEKLASGLSVFMGGKEQFEFMIRQSEQLQYMLVGDAMRLEQVLLNLCMNAIKFTPMGMVKLEIEKVSRSAEAISLSFTVADTGIGMNEEKRRRLFQPFTQGDSSTTRQFGGTGLGLVISKNLVELMGGALEVNSEEGVGSVFRFILPFAISTYRQEQPAVMIDSGSKRPIWIVEDNTQMMRFWEETLARAGVSSLTFNGWQSARDRLRVIGEGARPLLLLMDMEMPDMYGIDTWLEFRQTAEEAAIPIIAVTTTYGRDELLQLQSHQQPIAILTKPVTRLALCRALNVALEKKGRDVQETAEDRKIAVVSKECQPTVRILLAEDNKINQLVAVELLKELGYEVGVAENGKEALEVLAEGQWDLVLMDIHMPVMDGTEAVRIMRSRREYDHIPVIAVTANMVKKDHEYYIRLGMRDVITKPLSLDTLQETITYCLDEAASGSKLSVTDGGGLLPGVSSYYSHTTAIPSSLGSIAGMDVASALERVNGKISILLHMIGQFKMDYERFMDQLRLKLDNGERQAAIRMLHTLKGAAGYLSAYGLADAAGEAGKWLNGEAQQSSGKSMQALLARLEKELTKLLVGLKDVPTKFDK